MHKKCAVCGKTLFTSSSPFCSLRCRTIDLGNWLGETYRVATSADPSDSFTSNDADHHDHASYDHSSYDHQSNSSDDHNKIDHTVKATSVAVGMSGAFSTSLQSAMFAFPFTMYGKPSIN